MDETYVDEMTFPTALEMAVFLNKQKINAFLVLIRRKMLSVINSDRFIILTKTDLAVFTTEIITSVKNILIGKTYRLVEREDDNGNSTGFKVCW
jgi:hypothetical protein